MADEDLAKDIMAETADLANLFEANLIEADLKEANLKGANLKGARLQRVNLHRARLQGANLNEVKLQEGDLEWANLEEANLHGAYLQAANLNAANLKGAILKGANLKEARLRMARLQDADLQGAFLQRADLQGADLQGADLREADLREADLRDVVLRDGDLQRTFLAFAYANDSILTSLPPEFEIRAGRIIPIFGEPAQNAPSVPPSPQKPRSEIVADIGIHLAAKPDQNANATEDLASLFDSQITWWESKKPNQDDEDWQNHYEFLKQIRDGFKALSAQIRLLENQPTPENKETAGEQALDQQNRLNTWLNDYADTIAASGKVAAGQTMAVGGAAALIAIVGGASVGLSWITGLSPWIAFGAASAYFGGPSVVKLAKKGRSSFQKDNMSEDKPSDDDGD